MNTSTSVTTARAQLLQRLFPEGVPPLWCPSLTHYDEDGRIDERRIAAHLRHLSPAVKGLLIPGSTGDGWELTNGETKQLLNTAFDHVEALGLHLLVGVLKPTAEEARAMIADILEILKVRTGESSPERALAAARVCGFTVCAPHGSALNQQDIERGLSLVLEMGLPTAIYQLPQVTRNELSPEVVATLAQRFENFVLFKDSSGNDRVVTSQRDLGGVFTMRGAEGEYTRWLRIAGGLYDGFLLSTANCFAREFEQLIHALATGNTRQAEDLSVRVSRVVSDVFDLVKDLPDGNAFANANKAIDHFFAHGERATQLPPPRLHSGRQLPVSVMKTTGEIFARYGLMPLQGYLGR